MLKFHRIGNRYLGPLYYYPLYYIRSNFWVRVYNWIYYNAKLCNFSEDVERHGGISGLSEAIVCETTVSGLHPATAYTVRLAAYNTIEHSSYSEPVVVKTQEEGLFRISYFGNINSIICSVEIFF